MSRPLVAVIGAGPYGLSLAAHLAALGIEHRIFGHPMAFWTQIARAGGERYLKSYCFGTNLSSPAPGFTFADYNRPRGLETFEPCSMANFARYGLWFQERNVGWVERLDVSRIEQERRNFAVTLASGERFVATQVVIATGLAHFAQMPPVLAGLPGDVATHSSKVESYAAFKASEVAVVGAGQSALEAAALLREAGATPHLIVRKASVRWMNRVPPTRNLRQRLRSPISGLGTGPKAWALTRFPGVLHHMPERWRTRFVRSHLPPEGAWWLRERVEHRIPVHTETTVIDGRREGNRVALRLQSGDGRKRRTMMVDHVIAGTGYDTDVERIEFLDPELRGAIERVERSPRLDSTFQSSIPGLRFIGPVSAMSFGPLFRFVVGAEYTAQRVARCLASELSG